ncbi:MAG TPA: hypothetical protein VGJ05_03435 [Fimbriiglobus sp.]|jgi:hypothetical protein
MQANSEVIASDRLEALDRRQRRTTRWLLALGVVVILQAAVIAYLARSRNSHMGYVSQQFCTVRPGKGAANSAATL